MKLLDILKRSNIRYSDNVPDTVVKGITSRSFEVKKDFVFVCLKGTKNDGHDHIGEALNKGACAVVIEDPKYYCDRAITVDSTRRALANMLNVFNGEPTKKLRFIGVTGTNGKTSVSVMIKKILDDSGLHCELIGTLNCSSFSEKNNASQMHFTTPDPEELYPMLLRMSEAGIDTVVMEASSHALKLKKLDPIEFEIGIFTNLTEDHLDFHLSMEDYFKSKLELFNKCRIGIINVDDDFGERISGRAPCEIKTCSMDKSADYIVKDLTDLFEEGTKFALQADKRELEIKCNIPGRFSVMNAMQSCACAIELGIDDNTIKRSFESIKNVKGRLEKIELFEGRGFAVYIDYAHTPDAISKLLDTATSFKKKEQRVVLLFGCGGDREKQKRKIMGNIAVNKSDFVIITSDNPRNEEPIEIIDDILLGVGDNDNFTVIPDRRRAIEYAIANAEMGDIILLAGKGHESYEINSKGSVPFDEREILFEIDKNYKEE